MHPLDLIQPGQLIFDIGANVGDKTQAFLDRGAACVVAVEPSPDTYRTLCERFQHNPITVHKVQAAVTEAKALPYIWLAISDHDPAFNTLSPEIQSPDVSFHKHGHRWSKSLWVPTTTLDKLIAQFGMPYFIKIDVEGHEAEVLEGLSQLPPYLSFEFHQDMPAQIERCLQRLTQLNSHIVCNLSLLNSDTLAWPLWQHPDKLLPFTLSLSEDPPGWPQYGDIYIRRVPLESPT